MGAILTALRLTLGTLAVGGSSTCPKPADVAAELARLVPSAGVGPSARIDAVEGGIRIELVDAEGATVGTRVLGGSTRCADLAAASAVVIATWLTASLPGRPAPLLPEAQLPETPEPASSSVTLEVAVGAVASFAPTFGLGAQVSGSLTRAEGGLGGRVCLSALGAHDVSLEPGKATWQRYALEAGPHRRFRPGPWKIDAHAGAAVALLTVAGDEATPGASRTSFDPGLEVEARAVSPPGLWLAASASLWTRPEVIASPGASQMSKVPQFEMFLTAGVAWSTE